MALHTPKPQPLRELTAFRDLARLPRFWLGLRRAPRGSATVMVVPGFRTGDEVTWLLRRTLGALGHDVHGWGLGTNRGNVERLLPRLRERVRELVETTGGPVHLIGWSLGGYLAREVARDDPNRVSQVITLGSPVIGGPKYTVAARHYVRAGINLDDLEREVAAREEVPLRIPVTAIYSQSDTVVCPAACIDSLNHGVEHIEVDCAHAGFAFSPEVYDILAARLASPPAGASGAA